jgi:hypothetical protein
MNEEHVAGGSKDGTAVEEKHEDQAYADSKACVKQHDIRLSVIQIKLVEGRRGVIGRADLA